MRTLIRSGLVVTADGSFEADVLVDDETIAAVAGRGSGQSRLRSRASSRTR